MAFSPSVIQASFPLGARPGPAFASALARATPNARSLPLRPEFANLLPRHGQPLPPAILPKMESAFGTTFRDVRVHVMPQARQMGARAFTGGSNIYFAPGQYDPAAAGGRRLLAHELAMATICSNT